MGEPIITISLESKVNRMIAVISASAMIAVISASAFHGSLLVFFLKLFYTISSTEKKTMS